MICLPFLAIYLITKLIWTNRLRKFVSLGTRYDLLLDWWSKFRCIEDAYSKGLWLFMACRRWHESTGNTFLLCFVHYFCFIPFVYALEWLRTIMCKPWLKRSATSSCWSHYCWQIVCLCILCFQIVCLPLKPNYEKTMSQPISFLMKYKCAHFLFIVFTPLTRMVLSFDRSMEISLMLIFNLVNEWNYIINFGLIYYFYFHIWFVSNHTHANWWK